MPASALAETETSEPLNYFLHQGALRELVEIKKSLFLSVRFFT